MQKMKTARNNEGSRIMNEEDMNERYSESYTSESAKEEQLTIYS